MTFWFAFRFQGDYSVCLNNVYSHMTSKLVYVYILTFKSEDLVTKFQKDKELNETAHMAKVGRAGPDVLTALTSRLTFALTGDIRQDQLQPDRSVHAPGYGPLPANAG